MATSPPTEAPSGPPGGRAREATPPGPQADLITLGRRLRHFRTTRGLTLDALGEAVGTAPSLLSMIENGRREPRLSLLQHLAQALDVPLTDLLTAEPPSRRAALEIALDRAQRGPLFAGLGLPSVKASQKLPLPVLENLVGLHAELQRRASSGVATASVARRWSSVCRPTRFSRTGRGSF